jgi:hypothetical protein
MVSEIRTVFAPKGIVWDGGGFDEGLLRGDAEVAGKLQEGEGGEPRGFELLLEKVGGLVVGLPGKRGLVEELVGRVRGLVGETLDSIGEVVRTQSGRVEGVVRELSGRIGGVVRELSGRVGGVVRELSGRVMKVVGELLKKVGESVNEELRRMDGNVGEILGEGEVIRELVRRVGSLSGEF